jgi:hypothetical protein
LAGNDFCGFGLRFERSGGGLVDFAGDGSVYATGGNGNMGFYGYQFNYTGTFDGAGIYTIYHRNYTAHSQPDNFCPNSSDNSRLSHQTSGSLQIIEYAN